MFIERMLARMQEKNITKKQISRDLGFGINQIKYWQDHQNTPSADVLDAIAEYLEVSVEYLLGKTDLPTPPSLSAHECRVLQAYRDRPAVQPAVDSLLGLSEEELIPVYAAAHSEDNHPDGIVWMTREQWEALQNLPESDDPLL